MRTLHLTIIFVLCISLSVVSANGYSRKSAQQDNQVKDAELQKLEALLKKTDELDKLSIPIKVDVKGDKEKTGKIKISIEREDPANLDKSIKPKKFKEKDQIDLSKINVTDEYIDNKIAAGFSTSTKCGSIDSVIISQIDVSRYYRVKENYIYNSGAHTITVFEDFRYDRASIPRILWAIIDKDSLGNVAPLIHDLLYRHAGVLPANQVSPYRKFSRKEADILFLEIMEKCGVPKTRRLAAYEAVRNFSGWAWKDQ